MPALEPIPMPEEFPKLIGLAMWVAIHQLSISAPTPPISASITTILLIATAVIASASGNTNSRLATVLSRPVPFNRLARKHDSGFLNSSQLAMALACWSVLDPANQSTFLDRVWRRLIQIQLP